jgi:hypothetical protein
MFEQEKRFKLDCDKPSKDKVTETACQELENFSDGDQKQKLEEQSCVCTLLYDPVKLVIEGQVKGRPFLFSHTFGNPCMFYCMTKPIRHVVQ